MNIYKLVLLPLLMFSGALIAQEKRESIIPQIIIEGELIDNTLQSQLNQKRRVFLNVSTFGSDISIAPYDVYNFTGYEKFFKMVLPSLTDYTYINFSIEGIKERRSADNIYIFEKGDSLKFKISGQSYKFYGKGADKLNCQSEIYDLQFREKESELKLLNNRQYEAYFNITSKRSDSIFKKQIEILNKYALKLGKKMTEIMLANIYGLRYASTLSSYIMGTRLSDPDLIPAFINSQAYQTIDLSLNQKLDPKNLTASSIYCNFLLEKIVVDNLIDGESNILRSTIEMPDLVYNTIKNSYHGLLREKLFAMFFLKYKAYSTSYLYLNEAILDVKNNEIRAILLEIKNTKAIGVAFFPFELENSIGGITRLSDLNGKVIVLDFWYTGCENCIMLHQGMKGVVEKFRNNPNVKFVSVSIDQNKSSWLKSVASGKYTDPNGLNLYTNGLGDKHPMIEKYHIRGYPTLFVLKNGKIVSSGPPRPGPSAINPSHSAARMAFVSLIEEALIEPAFLP